MKSNIKEQDTSKALNKIENRYSCNIYEHLPAESNNWADVVEKEHSNTAQQSTKDEQPKEIVLTFKKWLHEHMLKEEHKSSWPSDAYHPYINTILSFREYLESNGKLEKDDELGITTTTAHHIIYDQKDFELVTMLINELTKKKDLLIDKTLGKTYRHRMKDDAIVFSDNY